MGSIGRSSTSAFNHNNKSNYSLSSQCLKYGRVKLYTELDPQLHKRLIDSVFIQLNETLQKIELQLGYKLTADIELQLFTDLDSYNDAFKETKIYVEQHNISRIYTKEKIFPLFVAQRFQDIKSDIQFLVSYILLDEFLHGVGVKQRLNQGDAVRLPIWLIHGYCYLNAKPWSAKDADQFLFFSNQGYYENLHKIASEAQATFGKYIWNNILSSSNKNIESTIWFTVKYTNQLNEAFLFQFKQTFDEWYRSIPAINLKTQLLSSDIPITSLFTGKTIQNISANKFNSYLILLSDEISDKLVLLSEKNKPTTIAEFNSHDHINPWFRKNEYQLWYDSITNKFFFAVRKGLSCSIFTCSENTDLVLIDSLNLKLDQINTGLTYNIHKYLSNNYDRFINSIAGSVIEITTEVYSIYKNTQHLLVTSRVNELQNNKNGIQAINIIYLLSTYKIQNHSFLLVRTDTFNKLPVIGSILTETSNRISYTSSYNHFWKLNFIEFYKDEDLQWNTGFTLNNFKHFKDYRDQILETGNQYATPIIKVLNNWQETKQEIIKLYKQFEPKDTLQALVTLDTVELVNNIIGFQFISNFSYRSWQNKTKQQLVDQYTGDYQIQFITPGYYLKHAGIYLSNYENRDFTYYNRIPLKNLINSPFTPTIRLHIADKLNNHNLTMMIFSNIVGSRMGMEIDQHLNLNKNLSINHRLLWRNRNFVSEENNYVRNSSLSNVVGLSKHWSNCIITSLDGEIRYDAFYSRISSLSQPITPSTKNVLGSLLFSIGYNSMQKSSQTSLKRWNIQSKLTAGPTFFGQNNSNNFIFKVEGFSTKSVGKHFLYRNRFSSIYTLGKTQTLYLIGGTDGWINNQQYIDQIPAIKLDANFNMIGFGLPVRGFVYGSRIGSSYISIQQQLEIDFFKSLIKNQIRNIFISDLTSYLFGDAGMAFVDKNPNSLSNPYHTKQIRTSNYQLWYTSIHNPWIFSLGFGVRTYIMGFPLKYEFSVPWMDKKSQKPQHLIGLHWDF